MRGGSSSTMPCSRYTPMPKSAPIPKLADPGMAAYVLSPTVNRTMERATSELVYTLSPATSFIRVGIYEATCNMLPGAVISKASRYWMLRSCWPMSNDGLRATSAYMRPSDIIPTSNETPNRWSWLMVSKISGLAGSVKLKVYSSRSFEATA